MVLLPGDFWIPYNRVSSEEQARSADALTRQIFENNMALFDAGKEAPEEPEYVDIQSGWDDNEHNRPAFSRLLGEISAGRVDGVVVTEISRIGREMEVLSRFWKFLEKNRTQLYVITKGRPYLFESQTSNRFSNDDWSDFISDAVKSESESRKISSRVSRARAYDRHLKRAHPQQPFGYRRGEDKKYEPDLSPWEAIPGMTVWDVAIRSIEILEEENFTRSKALARIKAELKKHWTVSGFACWLTNEVLCGHTPYLRYYESKHQKTQHPEKIKNRKKKMSALAQPGDRYGAPTILHRNTHARLISPEQERELKISFRLAQSRNSGHSKHVYPLSGISRCAECGAPWSWKRSVKKKYNYEDYYGFCRNRHLPCAGPEDKNWCPSRELNKIKDRSVKKGIRQEDAERVVAEELAKHAEEALAQLNADRKTGFSEESPERLKLEMQITQISGLIAQMGDSEGHLRAQIEMLQKQIPQAGELPQLLGEEDQKVLESLRRPEVILDLPVEKRKEIYLRFVRRIEFWRDAVQSVIFYF